MLIINGVDYSDVLRQSVRLVIELKSDGTVNVASCLYDNASTHIVESFLPPFGIS